MTEPNGALMRSKRIELIDLGRGIALAAMAVYHFTWDLEFFGYVEAGTVAVGGWKLFARCIASSFLFLVGFSLVLAHGAGIQWRGFGRRLAIIAGAAAAITLATFLAMPDAFIFFGILHQIAVASLLGLAFLRLPWPVTLLAAAATVAAPQFLRSEIFNHPALWWVGLSTALPRSNDYVPLFPWFGAVLAGIAAATLSGQAGLHRRLAAVRIPRIAAPLLSCGRHSLAFYLLHQPVLIGALSLFSLVFPPAAETREAQFLRACEAACLPERDMEFCTHYCACVIDGLEEEDAAGLSGGAPKSGLQDRVEGMTYACTAQTERAIREGDLQ